VDIPSWLVLVYRVPSEPASRRVAIWRELKRLGALYLQQCVCILPDIGRIAGELERVSVKIEGMSGEHTLFEVPRLRPEAEKRIVAAFRALRDKEYAEIVEECETKFVKEVEFEHFRQNYTFEEAEEIAQDLDKIRRWYASVHERDWFGADRSGDVEGWLERCAVLLAGFEEEVYRRTGSEDNLESATDGGPARLTLRDLQRGPADEDGRDALGSPNLGRQNALDDTVAFPAGDERKMD
jgi:hypothetical protein